MTIHVPRDPEFASRVRRSFDRQLFMATIGAQLVRVEPGEVDLELSMRDDLTQQHGFLHAGVLAAVADSACGYAALSLMPPGAAVLSAEFKINLLSPAGGQRIIARGRVIKSGRVLSYCRADVMAVADGTEKLVAALVGTMMTVQERGLSD